MQITVIGTGFVGVVTAGVFAKFGNSVVALDVDRQKINALKKGEVPFYEPNLTGLIKANLKAGRLSFTTEYKLAIANAEVVFICVGTPSAANGQADLRYVFQVAKSLSPYIQNQAIIVIKSTVPPNTNLKIEEIIKKKTKKKFFTASIPEFLKEGSAVSDALNPGRVIIGANQKYAIDKLSDLHKSLKSSILIMSPQSAQMVKYAANAYLASRITFINQIADLCEQTGANIEEVVVGLGSDERIGTHYWYPGPGYGGSCFPKDVKELSALANNVGKGDGLFEKIDQLNNKRINNLIDKYRTQIGGYKGKKIAVLGLSFKPNTNDMREAPSIKFIPKLISEGAKVVAYDPKAVEVAKKILPKQVEYGDETYQIVKGADVLLILIEWDEFKQLNLKKIKKLMKGKVFIDTRNIYDPKKVQAYGFKYIGIGR